MKTIDLCGSWRGECIFPDQSSFSFSASVPGSAINDLVSAGRLPQDLFWRDNADAVLGFESCDYVYRKSFAYHGDANDLQIRFERIDTYADVFLNGKKIYHCENGNIRHDIDVSDSIRIGENELEVRLYSPSEWVKDLPLGKGAFTTERLNTRRMQCTYGWDWVARFLTVGLGECHLISHDELEILAENVYIATMDADAESASVRVDVAFRKAYAGRILTFSILNCDGEVVSRFEKYCREDFVRLDFDVPFPRLWYPVGYGEPTLYSFTVEDGESLLYSENFGIRTAKIMQLPDAPKSVNFETCLSIKNPKYDFNQAFSGFTLKINGEKVFCRGANWVPCVPYGIGNVDQRQTEILELCREAGVNMLRVWGGGAFETRHFYSECSRLGIMVTQDFLMACGTYPEEQDWFIEQLRLEADYVARLCRNEPCLVWWSGDNENAVNGCDTDENYTGRRSAYEGIAPILYRLDPYRRFFPSSPFGGKLYASNTVGTTHNTQFLRMLFSYIEKDDLADYKDELKKFRARFIAEEPQLGAVSISSLRRFMTEEDIFGGDEMWSYHTKSNPSLSTSLFEYLLQFSEKVLGGFASPKDRLFKLRYMQYEWLRVVTEQARRENDLCSGIIFWMMNDCWPAASGWALIDYYNLPKDAYYSFKRCAKPTIVSIDRADGRYRVHLISDAAEENIRVRIRRLKNDGCSLTECADFIVSAEKSSAKVIYESDLPLAKGEVLLCDIESEKSFDRAFYREGDLKIVPCDVVSLFDLATGVITLSAGDRYIHAVTVSGNAIFSDNCFSLLPGEVKTVSFRPLSEKQEPDLSVEAYTLA